MNLELVGKDFCKKFFLWRLQDARREVSQDFYFLRQMKNPYILRGLVALHNFSSENQLKIMHTLIKQTLKPSLLMELGEEICIQDLELLKKFYSEQRRVSREDCNISKLFDVRFEQTNFKKFKIKDLKNNIVNEFERLPNCKLFFKDSNSVIYHSIYKQWIISTAIDCEKICYHYSQQVYTHENDKRVVLGGIYTVCLNEWLGFRNHSTWCFISEEDPLVNIQLIADLSQKFISTIPTLLGNVA